MSSPGQNGELQKLAQQAAGALKSSWITVEEHSWVPITLTEKQSLFLNLPHLEVLYGGAAGGGKTTAIAAGALQYVNDPNYHCLLLRRTFADLSKPGSLMDVLYNWLSGTGARWNDQKKQWRMPSGALIQFGYIETNQDKFRYKSDEYQSIFFDELTSFDEEPYVYLMSRLRKKKESRLPLRMRAGTNPGDIGAVWVMNRFVPDGFSVEEARANQFVEKVGFDAEGTEIKRAFVPALLTDNPGIDAESYLRSLNQLDPVTREQLLKGDWQIQQKGDVYPEWDERFHVITWSQFEQVTGSRRIPQSWLLGVGMDWGSTEGHPYAISFVARAGDNSPLAGKVFLYKAITGFAEPPRVVAEKIYDTLREDNGFDRVHVWLMSHEAKSVRDTMVMDHGLPFGAWKPDRSGGIAQVRDFLQVQGKDKVKHPFKDLAGSPSLFLIVDDEEAHFPKTDRGLARHRLEFPLYHYDEMGLPVRKINDAMDSLRGVAGAFFPPIAALSPEEQLKGKIDSFKLEDIEEGLISGERKAVIEMSQKYHIDSLIREERARQGGSSHPLDMWKESNLK